MGGSRGDGWVVWDPPPPTGGAELSKKPCQQEIKIPWITLQMVSRDEHVSEYCTKMPARHIL